MTMPSAFPKTVTMQHLPKVGPKLVSGAPSPPAIEPRSPLPKPDPRPIAHTPSPPSRPIADHGTPINAKVYPPNQRPIAPSAGKVRR